MPIILIRLEKVITPAAVARQGCLARCAMPVTASTRRKCRPALSKTKAHDPKAARSTPCRCPRLRRYAQRIALSRRKIALISPHLIKMAVDFV